MSEPLLAGEPLATSEIPTENALGRLRKRAADQRYDPWLFYTRGLRWRWRSYEQVADHVARASASIERAVSASHRAEGVAFREHRCPDSISLSLAIQATGGTAVAMPDGQRAPASSAAPEPVPWVRTENDPPAVADGQEWLEVPVVRSNLERWDPEPLPGGDGWVAAGRDATLRSESDSRRFSSAEIASAAAYLEDRLDPLLQGVKGSPVLLLGPSADCWQAEVLTAWTLLRGAPLVLEPDAKALASTALWARPHLVVASSMALEDLARLLGERSHLTSRRLKGLVATDDEAPSSLARLRWGSMAVPLYRWVAATARWQDPYGGSS